MEGISAPPAGAAGVVGCCDSHEVLGLQSARVAAAQAQVQGSLLAGIKKIGIHNKTATLLQYMVFILLSLILLGSLCLPCAIKRKLNVITRQ